MSTIGTCEEELADNLPSEVYQELEEEEIVRNAIVEALATDVPPPSDLPSVGGAEALEQEDAALLHDENAIPSDMAADAAPDGLPDSDTFRDNCIIDSIGSISCSLEPWLSWGVLGKLTTWPSHKPEAQRSMSVKCALHYKCSVAKKRNLGTDEKVLWWLYSAGVPTWPRDAREQLAAAESHRRQWVGLF